MPASSSITRWFYWGTTLAVVRGYEAFSVQRPGWRSVNEADVCWDGRPVTEELARSVFGDDFKAFGEPPFTRSDPPTPHEIETWDRHITQALKWKPVIWTPRGPGAGEQLELLLPPTRFAPHDYPDAVSDKHTIAALLRVRAKLDHLRRMLAALIGARSRPAE